MANKGRKTVRLNIQQKNISIFLCIFFIWLSDCCIIADE